MAKINKIKLSGTSYDIQDLNASKTVELTQAQYDALVTKDPNTFYIITDAQGGDLSQYWTSAQTNSAITSAVSGKADTSAVTQSINAAVSGKVDTSTFNTYSGSVETALASKQTTLTAGTGINITDNVISATGGGGGKAVSAGTNISITTGETADTINCTVPYVGSPSYKITYGYSSTNKSQHSLVIGAFCSATSSTQNNIVVGIECHSMASHNAAFGFGNYSNNEGELSSGYYNISNSGSTNADKTLFSVGNGTSSSARHNAFEVRQNGDIYISSGGTDILLQDHLGGGGGASYSAGTGIDITNNVISVSADTSLDSGSTNAVANSAVATKINNSISGTSYMNGGISGKAYYALTFKRNDGASLDVNNAFHVMPINGKYPVKKGIQGLDWYDGLSLVETSAITTAITSSSTDAQVPSAKAVYDQLGGLQIVKITESEYAALVTKDENTLYVVVPDPSN